MLHLRKIFISTQSQQADYLLPDKTQGRRYELLAMHPTPLYCDLLKSMT